MIRYVLTSLFVLCITFKVQANIQKSLEYMCQNIGNNLGWIMEVSNDDEAINHTLKVYKKELFDIEKEIWGKDVNKLQEQIKDNQFFILKNKLNEKTVFLVVLKDSQTLKIMGTFFIEEIITQDYERIWHLRTFGLYNDYKKHLNCIKKTFAYVKDMAKNANVDKIVTLGMQDDKFIINLILMRFGFDEDLNYSSDYKIASYEKYFSMNLKELN